MVQKIPSFLRLNILGKNVKIQNGCQSGHVYFLGTLRFESLNKIAVSDKVKEIFALENFGRKLKKAAILEIF